MEKFVTKFEESFILMKDSAKSGVSSSTVIATRSLAALLCALANEARSEDAYLVEANAATYLQVAKQALLPGANGVLVDTRGVAPFFGYGFLKVQGVDVPWARDAVSAELAAWGSVGFLAQPVGESRDGDLTAAWVKYQGKRFSLKLGRQVSMPGATRFVRFDGATVGLEVLGIALEGYSGLVALPRWNRPSGYFLLGSMRDAVRDGTLVEAQSREGDWLIGAKLGLGRAPGFRASLGYHEQHRGAALAFRNTSVDFLAFPGEHVTLGGRAVLDLAAMAPSEARLYVDVTASSRLPLTIEYSFQAPSLLLPHASVLAAFGGASWNELSVEATYRPHSALRLTGRAGVQLYERNLPGARASVKGVWVPDLDGRVTLVGEYGRVAAYDNGYHQLRLAMRARFTDALSGALDSVLYLYDRPLRQQHLSAVGSASLDYALRRGLSVLVSGSLASTPFAVMDAQFTARAKVEFDATSVGGRP
jgi:hypothetical protein